MTGESAITSTEQRAYERDGFLVEADIEGGRDISQLVGGGSHRGEVPRLVLHLEEVSIEEFADRFGEETSQDRAACRW